MYKSRRASQPLRLYWLNIVKHYVFLAIYFCLNWSLRIQNEAAGQWFNVSCLEFVEQWGLLFFTNAAESYKLYSMFQRYFIDNIVSLLSRNQSTTMKYILVTGGVISGIGKGIIASSVGTILKSCGLHVTAIKIDPYINIDAGTFSPYEHGGSSQSAWRLILRHCSLFICIDRNMLMLCRRSVCAGRRRRGGLGSGKLRAFPRHSAHERQQPDHRQDLPVGHQQGEEGRLPGQDSSGYVLITAIK